MQHSRLHCRGYTLIELIVVMLLVGILAATVAVRLSAKGERAAIAHADQLRRDLAHIQVLTLGWGVGLRLTLAADGASYTLTCLSVASGTPCTSVGAVPIDPASGEPFSVVLTDSVLIAPAGNTVDFDSLGRPLAGTDLIAANPARTYTFTGGSRSATVLLRPITGFTEVSY